jgi:N-acetylmuramoyl-L-alanine amidase
MARTARTDDRRRRPWTLALLGLLTSLAVCGSAHAVAQRPGRIERVRYEATATSTRVIITLSRPIPFYVRILGGESTRKSERRLVLDFSNATLAPEALTPIGVENGLLQQIRTGQFNARTARVVLDLASITKHSVDAYESPPHVTIDIAGTPAPDGPVIAAPERAAPPAAAPAEDKVATAPPPAPAVPPTVEEARPQAREKLAKSESPALDRGTLTTEATGTLPEPVPVPSSSPKREGASKAGKDAGSDPLPGRPGNRPWRIVLDPGHGGADPGASGVDGLLEKEVTLAIAQRLKRRLEESSNAKVLLTRETDATRTLAERTAFANANRADLFISIHVNADRSGELQGIETYTLNNSNDRATIRLAKMENGPSVRVGRGDLSFILSDMVQSGKEEESNALAERLHSRVLARLRSRYTDIHNLGVKKGPFYVLVGAYMPCVLFEASFLSHPTEGKRLGTVAYQQDIAEGLFLGITDFLGDARLAKTL